MDPRDQIDIASLAGQSQAYLNKLWNTPRQNRVDPRQILGQQGHPGFPQQQPYGPQGIPPQQFNPQYQQEYPGIPSQLDSGGVNLLPMPMDEKGQPIVPAGVNFIPGMPQAAQGFSMDNAQGFSMPNYGGKDQAAANAATDAKLDEALNEIKLLKRAVNTLTNLIRKSVIAKEKSNQPEIINESNS